MAGKKITLVIDEDLVPWASFAAGLRDMSQTAYVNDAIRRDRDSASESVRAAYDAFVAAREDVPKPE